MSSATKLVLEVPALARATAAVMRVDDFIGVQAVRCDLSPTAAGRVAIMTLCEHHERDLDGKELLVRIERLGPTRPGYAQAQWLSRNRDQRPELMALLLTEAYVWFPGTIVGTGGGESLPFLDSCGVCFYAIKPDVDYPRDKCLVAVWR